jgi:glutamate-1-semialdehyde aminotransferase
MSTPTAPARTAPSFPSKEGLLARARKVIPGCTQAFSKGLDQYPQSVSPHYIVRGKGARVEDVDGNAYYDFAMGLAPVVLGYADPDVDRAVAERLQEGTVFTLSHPLEIELAELLVETIPCAEMVRYGKNGSDATTGAVRLARAFTKRDRVACCGYHGWHDWYIGSTTRNLGVPVQTAALTHSFPYNDLEALDRLFRVHPGEFACAIIEPTTIFRPSPGYLEGIKALCQRRGVLLIFDEIVTGFRLALGGAQEYFGVTPDLACCGKAMANGYPISVVAGRADIMRLFEEVFFSHTFAGEAVGLAAALATIHKLRQCKVHDHLWEQGERIIAAFNQLAAEFGLDDRLTCVGYGPRSVLQFRASDSGVEDVMLKTFFQQEYMRRGILTANCHNMSLAHTAEIVDHLLGVYREVMELTADLLRNGDDLRDHLEGEPLEPVFRRPT